jgi:transcriptional regulator with XRE-family HTH domain
MPEAPDELDEQALGAAFGRALRSARMERGFSQEALGFACGRHRTYVSALERGTSSPTLQTVVRLARALGVDAAELVDRAERELDN